MKYFIYDSENLKNEYPNVFLKLNKFYNFNNSNIKVKLNLLNSIIEEKILNKENYKSSWEMSFLDKLSKTINYDVIGATYGLGPSLGGKIIINKDKDSKKTIELIFFISLLTNYYSIQIVNIDKYFLKNEYFIKKEAWGVNKIIVSPLEDDLGKLFISVENFILSEIKDAKFLPFKFDMIKIKDFQVNYKFVKDYSSVSDGFFSKGIVLHDNTEIIGYINYKFHNL